MNIENLIGTMIDGSLNTRRKRSHGAGKFLRQGGNSFLNASTLLTVGGLVWGVIETMQQQAAPGNAQPSPAAPSAAGPRPPLPTAAPHPSAPAGPSLSAPPPLPPLPDAAAPGLPEGAARLIRLMVSAARADGQATEAEKQAILAKAREVGAEALVEDEWLRPTPLASVVGVVNDAKQREDLYVLAYAIVRADEGITGAERIYLAQLASILRLDRTTIERLERQTDDGIAAA